MSSEEFKNKFESFLQNFTSKLSDNNLVQEIQNEYNDLMDLCKYHIIIINNFPFFILFRFKIDRNVKRRLRRNRKRNNFSQ
jgi:hypothetical protein